MKCLGGSGNCQFLKWVQVYETCFLVLFLGIVCQPGYSCEVYLSLTEDLNYDNKAGWYAMRHWGTGDNAGDGC
jgi:hypothetical protein